MPGGRLAKRIVFGNLEGAVWRGRGQKELEWIDCVQSDVRAFGIAGDWKPMALEAKVWIETVTEGGRMFIATWRKEEGGTARHKLTTGQRDWESCHRLRKKHRPREATPIGLVNKLKEPGQARDGPRPA